MLSHEDSPIQPITQQIQALQEAVDSLLNDCKEFNETVKKVQKNIHRSYELHSD